MPRKYWSKEVKKENDRLVDTKNTVDLQPDKIKTSFQEFKKGPVLNLGGNLRDETNIPYFSGALNFWLVYSQMVSLPSESEKNSCKNICGYLLSQIVVVTNFDVFYSDGADVMDEGKQIRTLRCQLNE